MAPSDAKREIITFQDFSGGEMGNRAPLNSTQHFRAINVWRYRNGGIGPRTAITAKQPTGLTARAAVMVNNNRGLRTVVVFDNNTVQHFTPAGVATATAAPAPRTPSDSVVVGSDIIYISAAGAGFEFTGLNIVAVPNLPAGVYIEKFLHRFIASVGPSLPGPTLRFSAEDDVTTWPAANTFSTGADAAAELWVQRNTLIIPDVNGSIFRVTGVLGVNETLTKIDQGPAVADGTFGAGITNRPLGGSVLSGNIWFKDGQLLVLFDGASIYTQPPISQPSTTGGISPSTRPAFSQGWDDDEFFWAYPVNSSTTALTPPFDRLGVTHHHPDGAFTQHLVPVTAFTPTAGLPEVFVAAYYRNYMTFILNGSTGGAVTPKIFNLDPTPDIVDFPSTTQNDGNSGAPVSATFRTADWHAPAGQEVYVEAVILDYSFLASNTNTLTLSIEGTQPTDTNTVRPSTGQVFVPTSNAQFPDYDTVQRGRQVFRMGDQGGSGWFRVLILNWTGILINQITVVTTVKEARI